MRSTLKSSNPFSMGFIPHMHISDLSSLRNKATSINGEATSLSSGGHKKRFLDHLKFKTMKKTSVLFIILLGLVFNLSASHYPEVVTSSDKSISVYFEDWNNDGLTVRIKNNHGRNLFVDKIKDNNITGKRYNLKNLIDGKYTLTISNKSNSMEMPFIIENEAVSVTKKERNTFYNPSVTLNDRILEFHMLALNKKIDISILDSKGKTVFKEKVANEGDISKVYDLSKFESGRYTLITAQDDHLSKDTFKLNK